jgi:hypothetical protein
MTRAKGLLLSAALMLAIATPAFAATNLGFNSGDYSGWTVSDSSLLEITAGPTHNSVVPKDDFFFASLAGGSQDVYTTLSRTIHLNSGDQLSGWVGFNANDIYLPVGDPNAPAGLNDSAYLKLNNDYLFQSDVATVGDGAFSGWTSFSYTASADGDFLLELGSANHGDGEFASYAVLDDVTLTPAGGTGGVVPEPTTWAMMIGGLAAIGMALRNRRQVSAFAG